MFDKKHSQRLTRLADALERDEHGHAKWEFYHVLTVYSCGTAGCAIGALPHIFPRNFHYSNDCPNDQFPDVCLNGTDLRDFEATSEFFGLSEDERWHLFDVDGHNPDEYGGKHLSGDATPQDVAAQIRAFLEIKAKESQ